MKTIIYLTLAFLTFIITGCSMTPMAVVYEPENDMRKNIYAENNNYNSLTGDNNFNFLAVIIQKKDQSDVKRYNAVSDGAGRYIIKVPVDFREPSMIRSFKLTVVPKKNYGAFKILDGQHERTEYVNQGITKDLQPIELMEKRFAAYCADNANGSNETIFECAVKFEYKGGISKVTADEYSFSAIDSVNDEGTLFETVIPETRDNSDIVVYAAPNYFFKENDNNENYNQDKKDINSFRLSSNETFLDLSYGVGNVKAGTTRIKFTKKPLVQNKILIEHESSELKFSGNKASVTIKEPIGKLIQIMIIPNFSNTKIGIQNPTEPLIWGTVKLNSRDNTDLNISVMDPKNSTTKNYTVTLINNADLSEFETNDNQVGGANTISTVNFAKCFDGRTDIKTLEDLYKTIKNDEQFRNMFAKTLYPLVESMTIIGSHSHEQANKIIEIVSKFYEGTEKFGGSLATFAVKFIILIIDRIIALINHITLNGNYTNSADIWLKNSSDYPVTVYGFMVNINPVNEWTKKIYENAVFGWNTKLLKVGASEKQMMVVLPPSSQIRLRITMPKLGITSGESKIKNFWNIIFQEGISFYQDKKENEITKSFCNLQTIGIGYDMSWREKDFFTEISNPYDPAANKHIKVNYPVKFTDKDDINIEFKNR